MFEMGHIRPRRAGRQVLPGLLSLQERPFGASFQIVAMCREQTLAGINLARLNPDDPHAGDRMGAAQHPRQRGHAGNRLSDLGFRKE